MYLIVLQVCMHCAAYEVKDSMMSILHAVLQWIGFPALEPDSEPWIPDSVTFRHLRSGFVPDTDPREFRVPNLR